MVTGDTTITEEDLAGMEETGMYSCLIIRSDGSGSLILMGQEWELTDRDVEKQTIRALGEDMQMLLEEDGTLSLQTASGDRMRFRLEEGVDPDDPATGLDALSKRFWPHKALKRVGDEQFGYFALPEDWAESTEDGRSVYTGDGVTLRLSTVPADQWDQELDAYFETLRDARECHGSEMAYRSLSTNHAAVLLMYLSDYENDLLYIGYIDLDGNLQLLTAECHLDTMSAVCESQSRTTKELRDLICESWRAEP